MPNPTTTYPLSQAAWLCRPPGLGASLSDRAPPAYPKVLAPLTIQDALLMTAVDEAHHLHSHAGDAALVQAAACLHAPIKHPQQVAGTDDGGVSGVWMQQWQAVGMACYTLWQQSRSALACHNAARGGQFVQVCVLGTDVVPHPSYLVPPRISSCPIPHSASYLVLPPAPYLNVLHEVASSAQLLHQVHLLSLLCSASRHKTQHQSSTALHNASRPGVLGLAKPLNA